MDRQDKLKKSTSHKSISELTSFSSHSNDAVKNALKRQSSTTFSGVTKEKKYASTISAPNFGIKAINQKASAMSTINTSYSYQS
jgi:hypothetical protein